MMYVVYIKDRIHHLLNEPEISIFVYNSDQKGVVCLTKIKNYKHSRSQYYRLKMIF